MLRNIRLSRDTKRCASPVPRKRRASHKREPVILLLRQISHKGVVVDSKLFAFTQGVSLTTILTCIVIINIIQKDYHTFIAECWAVFLAQYNEYHVCALFCSKTPAFSAQKRTAVPQERKGCGASEQLMVNTITVIGPSSTVLGRRNKRITLTICHSCYFGSSMVDCHRQTQTRNRGHQCFFAGAILMYNIMSKCHTGKREDFHEAFRKLFEIQCHDIVSNNLN